MQYNQQNKQTNKTTVNVTEKKTLEGLRSNGSRYEIIKELTKLRGPYLISRVAPSGGGIDLVLQSSCGVHG